MKWINCLVISILLSSCAAEPVASTKPPATMTTVPPATTVNTVSHSGPGIYEVTFTNRHRSSHLVDGKTGELFLWDTKFSSGDEIIKHLRPGIREATKKGKRKIFYAKVKGNLKRPNPLVTKIYGKYLIKGKLTVIKILDWHLVESPLPENCYENSIPCSALGLASAIP